MKLLTTWLACFAFSGAVAGPMESTRPGTEDAHGTASDLTSTQSTNASGDDDLAVEEMVERLAGPEQLSDMRIEPGTRAFRAEPRLTLQSVRFVFDSDRLTDEAQRVLDRVATVLQHERLANERFRVEGHTDATGTRVYNQSLSERRARAVRAYLVGLGLAEDRLDVIGRGEDALLAGEDPGNPRNRRVEIIRID